MNPGYILKNLFHRNLECVPLPSRLAAKRKPLKPKKTLTEYTPELLKKSRELPAIESR